MKRQRERSGLEREQRRRQAVEMRKRVEAAEARASPELSLADLAEDGKRVPVAVSTQPASATRVGEGLLAGRRLEQLLPCGWCGESIQIKARGRMPKWCSPTCRRRAWEQRRAARSGRAAIEVLDRYVVVAPSDTEGWLEMMRVMNDQVRRGQIHSQRISAALLLVQAAISEQEQQLPREDRW